MSDHPYVYPGTRVLRNKRGIRDADSLDFAERFYSAKRGRRGVPTGDLDLLHLRARVVGASYFKDLNRRAFATGAGTILGDVNYVHPFREGGRTQLLYLKQLAKWGRTDALYFDSLTTNPRCTPGRAIMESYQRLT